MTRASALTDRLKTVREKLNLAFSIRQRMHSIEGSLATNTEPTVSYEEEYAELMRVRQMVSTPQVGIEYEVEEDDALPGLGIDDDVDVHAYDRLPVYSDGLDKYIDDCPQEFVCPVTCAVMRYPVRTCDGHVYEKCAIEEWFRSFSISANPPTSPLTNLLLENTHLTPDYALRDRVQEWGRIMVAADPERAASTPTPSAPHSPKAQTNSLSEKLVFHGGQPHNTTYPQSPPASSTPDIAGLAAAVNTFNDLRRQRLARERREVYEEEMPLADVPPTTSFPPPSVSSPVAAYWSSSHVPEEEENASNLNALREMPDFEPPKPQRALSVRHTRTVRGGGGGMVGVADVSSGNGATAQRHLAQGMPRRASLRAAVSSVGMGGGVAPPRRTASLNLRTRNAGGRRGGTGMRF